MRLVNYYIEWLSFSQVRWSIHIYLWLGWCMGSLLDHLQDCVKNWNFDELLLHRHLGFYWIFPQLIPLEWKYDNCLCSYSFLGWSFARFYKWWSFAFSVRLSWCIVESGLFVKLDKPPLLGFWFFRCAHSICVYGSIPNQLIFCPCFYDRVCENYLDLCLEGLKFDIRSLDCHWMASLLDIAAKGEY